MVKRSRIVAFFLLLILIGSGMGLTTNQILNQIKLGLDLQGGFEILYEVSPVNDGQKVTQSTLTSTVEALDRRINVLGVSEPNIQIEGDDRIRVQLAGVEDQAQAREILSTEANLSFRDFEDNKLLDGTDLVEGGAKQSFDQYGKPNVVLELKDAGKFHDVTQQIVEKGRPNNVLVIWLDYQEGDSYQAESAKSEPKFISAPRVDEVFNQNSVTIEGNFTVEEAQTLANLLNAGALPVQLDEVYSNSVGAQFGATALDETVFAGIIGILAIFIFMIVYYRLPGVIAVVTLSIYLYLTLLAFDWMNAVLTLPGIAALILGVGMAVDANIITAERIREEIKVGKTIKSAFRAGEKNSLSTIFDANITTLIASIVLFAFGNSSVKGFATGLIVSILVSFITSVYASRWFMSLLVNSKLFDKHPWWFGVRKKDIHEIKENLDTVDLPTRFDWFDFVKHRKLFFTISSIFVVAGIVIVAIFRLNLAIDFTSGTRIEILANKEITAEEMENQLAEIDLQADDIVISGENKDIGVARLKGDLNQDEVNALKAHFHEQYGADPSVSVVSPVVGKELAKNALYAVLISSLGIIIYVAFRFEAFMGIASVLALLHDAFFIIVFFSITRLEVDLTFIAAVLTIIGYSINDTIVTFDRIRENLHKRKRIKSASELADIVNTSLRQTLLRSVNTMLTVLASVIILLIFGSESIRNFNVALLAGLISGTYSSLFIAAQLWYVWKAKELKKKGVLKTAKVKRKISDQPQV
ncbi:protein translocase subunit SecDF [Bacillaceae bacterium Marseille-Q3522]|nr:protein translocase subunit SecDF [Bacillaceae bacterium Marseille-Q3522]